MWDLSIQNNSKNTGTFSWSTLTAKQLASPLFLLKFWRHKKDLKDPEEKDFIMESVELL